MTVVAEEAAAVAAAVAAVAASATSAVTALVADTHRAISDHAQALSGGTGLRKKKQHAVITSCRYNLSRKKHVIACRYNLPTT